MKHNCSHNLFHRINYLLHMFFWNAFYLINVCRVPIKADFPENDRSISRASYICFMYGKRFTVYMYPTEF